MSTGSRQLSLESRYLYTLDRGYNNIRFLWYLYVAYTI